jgi:molecular chaperone DnaK
MNTIDFGIDLGTSNSAIALARNGVVELFRDTNNIPLVNSAVMMEAGRMVVGHKAYQRQWKEGSVAVKFKRALGTNQSYTLAGADRAFTAEELSAAVLTELKRLASLKGHTVDSAVICTPAKFTAAQCEATNAAAALAGLREPVLISEPMAASFGYGYNLDRQGTWIVYDLGAGTFDAVVVRMFEGRMQPQVPEGDNRLGGSDMDRVLWDEIVAPRIARELGIPLDHPIFSEGCAEGRRRGGIYACEAAKLTLSQQETAEINTIDIRPNFQIDGRDVELVITITRAEFESRVEPLIDRSVAICRKLIDKNPGLSEILLVGGPTVMPIVRAKLSVLPVTINSTIDPMTAVATGAALYASTLPAPRAPRPSSTPAAASSAVANCTESSPVQLRLEYEPTSELEDATLIIHASDPRLGWVEISTENGDYQSGRITPGENGHVLLLPLNQSKANQFTAKCFTPGGNPLPCEPGGFSIFRGLTAGAPPMPHSYRVELENPDRPDEHVDRILIQQGAPLPARGTLKARTTAEISRASNQRIQIKIWEGDRKNLRANLLAYSLELNGASIPRKLPANTEIEISLEVDASRLARARVYIPIADELIDIPKWHERIDVGNPSQLGMRRRWIADQIEQLETTIPASGKVALEVCRRRLFNPSINQAFRLAEQKASDAGDACARIDEALRETEDEVAILREQQQQQWIPAKWEAETMHAADIVSSPLALPSDRPRFESIRAEGDRAIASQRWGKAQEQIRDMNRLSVDILGRSPQFWINVTQTLPTTPSAYLNPAEAQRLMEEIPRIQQLDQLRSAVVRLHNLVPRGSGQETMLPTNLR